MADIVETVRAAAKHPANNHGPQEWLNEAADEIEKLRAALRPFACQCSRKGEGAGGTCLAPGGICRAWNARAALGGGDD